MKVKPGDIVLAKSPAGDAIPPIHVKLLEKVDVPKSSLGGGYAYWRATPVYQDEIDRLRKEWSIPFTKPGEDVTSVYEEDIIKKPRRRKKRKAGS